MSSPSMPGQIARLIGRKFYDYCKINGGGSTIEAYLQQTKEYTAAEVASAVSKFLSQVSLSILWTCVQT